MDRYSPIWYNALAQKALEKNISFLIKKMIKPRDEVKVPIKRVRQRVEVKKKRIGESGYPGIVNSSKTHSKPWVARSIVNKKYLGYFDSIEEALKAQDEYALKIRAA